MGKVHLGADELSALFDGELGHTDEAAARAHLERCPACAAQLEAFARLEPALAAPPAVPCGASLELRSALADRELTVSEGAVAEAHIAGCASCQAESAGWKSAEMTIRGLPLAAPSARVDAAIRALARPATPAPLVRRVPPLLPGAGLRVAAAVALAVALVMGLQPAGAPAPQAIPAAQQTLVASMQIVLYGPTNTYYVLQPQAGAVDAVAADSYALRTRIAVGGRPSALALNESAGLVLVLDPVARSITEIDANSNTVVSSTAVPIDGTPTSMQVDQASGKIVVASVPTPEGAGSVPLPTATAKAGGQVAVLDPTTKKLDVITTVDVAPQQVVTDPQGKGALLVSTAGSTLVDPSYRTLRKLPGGVGAAYGASGWIAILGGDSTGSVLTLVGDGAPAALRLDGAPRALTPMPDGGFAVLVGAGKARSRIVVVDASGTPVGVTDVDNAASGLTYDRMTGQFAVVAGGNVVSADLPSGLVAAAPSSVAPSARPGPSAPPTPQAGAPAKSAEPSASPSAPPETSAHPSAPVQAQLPPQASQPAPAVPDAARKVGDQLYSLRLNGGLQPALTASFGNREWFLDQKGALHSLDLLTGNTYRLATLPTDARVAALAANARYVFALDAAGGRVFTLSIVDEKLATWTNTALARATAIAATSDAAYIAFSDPAQLATFDPRFGIVNVLDAQTQRITGLAATASVVWFTDGARRLGRYDSRASTLTISELPASGWVSAMLADDSDRMWIGTTTGEVVLVQKGVAKTVLSTSGRPISALALDPSGGVWYLSAGPRGATQFVYAPVSGGGTGRLLPGPATSLAFNSAWRAWLADPVGGFYLGVEAAP